jgi:hypothetical protein
MKVLSELDVMASIGEEIDKISADELLKRGADMPDVQEGEEVIVVKTRGRPGRNPLPWPAVSPQRLQPQSRQ